MKNQIYDYHLSTDTCLQKQMQSNAKNQIDNKPVCNKDEFLILAKYMFICFLLPCHPFVVSDVISTVRRSVLLLPENSENRLGIYLKKIV